MKSKGWTLVELLVTIAIIGILTTVGFANIQSFSSEQKIDDGVNQVQSFIRAAQTDATSSLKCNNALSYSWSVVFKTDKKNIDLNCKTSSSASDFLVRTLTLPANITVNSIVGDGWPSCVTTFPANAITIIYNTLTGSVSFSDPGMSANCNSTTSNFVVTLTFAGAETTISKDITISTGGGIDAQN